ncbi:MAG: spore coat protein [Dethiobacteria bacterium]|jgi:similar to spore coat protein|nr:spore coat protein [Bacillota bacterium]HOP69997.1 spore coat protein [Bacillota bacterium]HQD06857.1 spore coat protein [Bacillota bacterium]
MNKDLSEKLSDQVIAADLLLSAKNGVRSYAYALTEASSSNVRSVLQKQLEEAISFHQQVADYMTGKGMYYPGDLDKQIQADLANAQTVSGTAFNT